MRVINIISATIALLLVTFCWQMTSYAQTSQEEYLNTKQKKGSFDDTKYNGLKKQLIDESSPNKSNNGKSLDKSSFSKEYSGEGSFYDYEKEEYKGEYQEYNYEYNEKYDSKEYFQPEYDDYDKEDPKSDADPNSYNDYSNEYDYYEKDYDQDSYNDYQNEKQGSSNSSRIKPPKVNPPIEAIPTSGEMQAMQVLLIILGAALVAFLIYYFFLRFNVDESGKKIEKDEDLPPMEIPKSELERRLEAAISNENYKEAVRIYFIFIIKDLSEKEWIKWEKDKTNMYYLFEMRKRSQYEQFNQVVTIFEWAWYGNYEIKKEQYNVWETTFKKLIAEINKK